MNSNCHDNKSLSILIRKEKSARKKLKLLAILHFQEGKSRYKIAEYLKVSRTSVNRWVSNYLSHGLSGLNEKPHPGRPCSLSKQQKIQLNLYIEKNIGQSQDRELTGRNVQNYILEKFGVDYEISSVYKIMDKLAR